MKTIQLPDMFFSTFQYAACKQFGPEWPRVLQELLAEPERGPEVLGVSGYAFATLWHARHVATCVTHVTSGTYISRARCLAGAQFLRGAGRDCDVWLTCDDDTYAEEETLRRLVTACRATRGLVALPSANRDGHSMCWRRVFGPTEYWLAEGEPEQALVIGDVPGPGRLPLRRVDRIGQGLVAMHRDLIAGLDALFPPAQRFRDKLAPDALDCAPLFLSMPVEGEWVGEDYFLCALAEREGHNCHVLCDAFVQHGDIVTKIGTDGVVHVVGQEKADAMQRGIERMNEEARAAGLAV